jgi:hypothetical protein
MELTRLDPPEWRLRVGEGRARFRHDPAALEILVLWVLPDGSLLSARTASV